MTRPNDTTPFCIAVDWGTTSFRLWVLDSHGAVLGESRGPEGMSVARERGFEAVLAAHMEAAGAPRGLPILACGMAGARQGWAEAPYVPVPATLATLHDGAIAVDTVLGDLRILPGVSQRDPAAPDVMRGEETQLYGLALADALVCMPGTHSKWVEVEAGTIRRFATYMTGELFAVLRDHSILRHAVVAAAEGGQEADAEAFLLAARAARAAPETLVERLFQLRAGPLLGFGTEAEGAARLSGLLIGAEIGAALRRFAPAAAGGTVTLLGAGALGALYEKALADAGLRVRTVAAEDATRRALHALATQLWACRKETA